MYGLDRYNQAGRPDGFLQALDSRLKIICLLCASVLAVVLDRTESLLILTGLSLAAAMAAGLDRGKIKLLLIMALLLTWGAMFSQSIFYYTEPRTVLLNVIAPDTPLLGPLVGNVSFYREGFIYGAVQSLRFSSMLVLGLVFCWTTESSAMFRGLLRLRLPFALAFMTVTAMRFLPTIADECAMVALAVRMRGGKVFSWNPVALASSWLNILRPVIINCYRRSNILALSIQARAFSPDQAVITPPAPLHGAQRVALWAFPTLTATVVAIKALYWCYLFDLYYNHGLRPIYEFARLYL
ncbi:energy-coupling factor transporter transmembrane component T family protein [Desulfarculus baarsii]